MFELMTTQSRIRPDQVIGIGGGGGNAVTP
jgi:cell division GTPase FtsZ